MPTSHSIHLIDLSASPLEARAGRREAGKDNISARQGRNLVGRDDISIGQDRNFIGRDDISIGQDRNFIGRDDISIGQDRSFIGRDDISIGQDRNFIGRDNIFIGQNRSFIGRDDISIGQDRSFIGRDNIFIGQNRSFIGRDNIFIGQNRSFIGRDDISIGQDKNFIGRDNISIGRYTSAAHSHSCLRRQRLRCSSPRAWRCLAITLWLRFLVYSARREATIPSTSKVLVAVAVLAAVLGSAVILSQRTTARPVPKAAQSAEAMRASTTIGPASIDAPREGHAQRPRTEAPATPSPNPGLVTGIVLDEAGSPAQADVVAINPWTEDPPQTSRSGKDGRFEVRLRARKWDLHAETPDSVSGSGEVDVNGDDPVQVKLVLRRPARIEGSVYDPEGRACPGARVSATCNEEKIVVGKGGAGGAGVWIISSSAIPRAICAWVETDELGRFQMEVPPGEVTLAARAHEMGSEEQKLQVDALHGAVVELHLVHDLIISGRVTDTAGKPVVGAEVIDCFSNDRTKTDADGRYRLDLHRGPSGCSLLVRAEGYLLGDGDRNREDPATVDIVLHRPATVRGVVRRADGSPAAGVEFQQATPGTCNVGFYGFDPRERVTSADGSFEIKDAWGGRSVVQALAQGGAVSESAPFDLDEGGTVEGVVVTLRSGATLRFRVLDVRDHSPLDKANIDHVHGSGANIYYTGGDGRYTFEHLPMGRYRFRIGHPGYATQPLEVDLSEGEDLEKEVLLGAGCTLRVRLEWAPGQGVTGTSVSACSPSGGVSSYASAPVDGVCEVRGLAPGPWDLVIWFTADAASGYQRLQRIDVGGEPTKQIDIHLSTRPLVQGRVRCAGAPLASRRVILVGRGAMEGVLLPGCTDAEGHAKWYGVDAGDYVAVLEEPLRLSDCPAASPLVHVPAGVDPVDVDLDLPAK